MFDFLRPGNGQDLVGPLDELFADIVAVSVNNPCSASDNIMAVTAVEVGSSTWGGEAAKLLRADRNPEQSVELLQAMSMRFTRSVKARTESNKTGADQTFFNRKN